MAFKIILSPRAVQDLREIVRYISLDNPERAESFGRELVAKTRLLATFPEFGRVVPELGEPDTREVIHKYYRIVYRVRHEQRMIEVARFWHGARGIPGV